MTHFKETTEAISSYVTFLSNAWERVFNILHWLLCAVGEREREPYTAIRSGLIDSGPRIGLLSPHHAAADQQHFESYIYVARGISWWTRCYVERNDLLPAFSLSLENHNRRQQFLFFLPPSLSHSIRSCGLSLILCAGPSCFLAYLLSCHPLWNNRRFSMIRVTRQNGRRRFWTLLSSKSQKKKKRTAAAAAL